MDFEKRAGELTPSKNVTTTVQQTVGHKSVRGSALPNPGLRVNKVKINFGNLSNVDSMSKLGQFFILGFERR